MKKLFFAVVVFLFVVDSFGCLNIYYSVDKEGHFHETEGYRDKLIKNFDFEFLETQLIKTEKKLREEKSYQLLSDYAVYLMKAGKVDESLQLLIVLAQFHPDEYQIAANLGTAYELSGNPDSALVYINRGIELNPGAHGSSEWVHVKILETKIKLRDQPDYLVTNSVLELTEAQEKNSKTCDQLLTQLRERLPFSPEGDDPIMASLFVDLGDCYANSVSIEYARAFYQLAQKYFGDKSTGTAEKIKEMERLSSDYQTLETTYTEHGENNKEERRDYTRVMKDNENSKYEINWENINTNVDSLLSFAGLTRLGIEPVDTLAPIEAKAPITQEALEVNENGGALMWVWILIGTIVILSLTIFLLKKRKV